MGLVLGFCSFILAIAVGLAVIFITGQPFLHDIDALNLIAESGYPREEIIANYNAVMDYLKPFNKAEFSLPSMKYSQSGAGHFADCRPIFNAFFAAGLICFLIILCIAFLYKNKSRRLLQTASIASLAIPAALLIGVVISFDKLFLLFHKVFFSNQDWIFDPATDEIINILPEEFFMHCVLLIACFWVLTAAILWALSCRYPKKMRANK